LYRSHDLDVDAEIIEDGTTEVRARFVSDSQMTTGSTVQR